MDDCKPLISVVTVVRNARGTLAQTLDSVLNQTYNRTELFVVDGASTDGTSEIVQAYSNRLTGWCSEPDGGIGDAMNKGLSWVHGDYVLFLHADDFLPEPSSLAKAVVAITAKPADINAFDILYGNDDRTARLRPRGFDWRMNFKTGIFHQGTLCRRALFGSIGAFDTSLKIAMDYDFFLRAYRAGASYAYFPLVLAHMRDTGISAQRDWPSLAHRFSEERQIHYRHSHMRWMTISYSAFWPAYLGYRRLRSLVDQLSTH